MKRLIAAFAAACIWAAPLPSLPEEAASVGQITIIAPKARPNLPNRPTAAYMMIRNEGEQDDMLVSAESPSFGAIELHTVEADGGVMKMMQVDGIDVPAGGSAMLEPGGFHLMLFEGVKPHRIGETFPITLSFRNVGSVTLDVAVERVRGAFDKHDGHSKSHGHD